MQPDRWVSRKCMCIEDGSKEDVSRMMKEREWMEDEEGKKV